MGLFIKKFWPLILVVIIALGAAFAIRAFGNHKYEAGVSDTKIAVERENARITAAMQEGKDREEAKYRGAVLARQAVESTLRDRDARIKRLLAQLRSKSTENTQAPSGTDGTGPDWVGLFGACYAEYYDVGRTAAEYADKINAWQGYYRGITEPAAVR